MKDDGLTAQSESVLMKDDGLTAQTELVLRLAAPMNSERLPYDTFFWNTSAGTPPASAVHIAVVRCWFPPTEDTFTRG